MIRTPTGVILRPRLARFLGETPLRVKLEARNVVVEGRKRVNL
jgi:hypothetical protein